MSILDEIVISNIRLLEQIVKDKDAKIKKLEDEIITLKSELERALYHMDSKKGFSN